MPLTRRFGRSAALVFFATSLVALHARAQDDSSEQRRSHGELPPLSEPTRERPQETQVEQQGREEVMARLDDPNIGLAFELVGGVMLLGSSRGQLVEPLFDWGARFTWEYGRMYLSDETLRDALWVDLTWSYAALHEGTPDLYTDSNYHYFTIAPAYEFVLSEGSPFGFYVQLGGGVGIEATVLHDNLAGPLQKDIVGIKSLFQYGVGFRGGPRPTTDFPFRISFRVELTRFLRGYMSDTFLGGSVGVGF